MIRISKVKVPCVIAQRLTPHFIVLNAVLENEMQGLELFGSCEPEKGQAFALPTLMTIETIETLAAELKNLPLDEMTDLVLDASQVEAISTPGLQLILSIHNTMTRNGGKLILQGEREAFTQAFRDAGLETILSTFYNQGA